MPTFAADEIVTAVKMNAIGGDWAAWTPTFTNFTLGNGTQVARYVQIGDTIICYWKVDFGSSTAVSGAVTISAPVTAHTSAVSRLSVGTARFTDNNGSTFAGQATLSSSTVLALSWVDTNGAVQTTSSTTPFTWVTSDTISLSATYEAA